MAFTGSEPAGQKINEAAARYFKQVALELGGKSPNIVFADAEFEAAVIGAIAGIFAASGQTCIAGSRLLLQRSIHDRFVERLVEVAGSARIGDPMDVGTHVGPVATQPQYEKVLKYIEIARRRRCALRARRRTLHRSRRAAVDASFRRQSLPVFTIRCALRARKSSDPFSR